MHSIRPAVTEPLQTTTAVKTDRILPFVDVPNAYPATLNSQPEGAVPATDALVATTSRTAVSTSSTLGQKLVSLVRANHQLEANSGTLTRLVERALPFTRSRATIELTPSEFVDACNAPRALLQCDAFTFTYTDEGSDGRADARRMKPFTTTVSSRAFMEGRYPAYLDETRRRYRGPEDATDERYIARLAGLGSTAKLLKIEAVRTLDRTRFELESLPKVDDWAAAAKPDAYRRDPSMKAGDAGTPVAVYYADRFAYSQRTLPDSTDWMRRYGQGRLIELGGVPHIVLTDGRVLAQNHAVFDVRKLRPDTKLPDEAKMLKRAFACYGRTWGHNSVNWDGLAKRRYSVTWGATDHDGPPKGFIDALRASVRKGNAYGLSGFAVLYTREREGRLRLAPVSLRDITAENVGEHHLLLPSGEKIDWTYVYGVDTRGGDSYGSLLPTMEHETRS